MHREGAGRCAWREPPAQPLHRLGSLYYGIRRRGLVHTAGGRACNHGHYHRVSESGSLSGVPHTHHPSARAAHIGHAIVRLHLRFSRRPSSPPCPPTTSPDRERECGGRLRHSDSPATGQLRLIRSLLVRRVVSGGMIKPAYIADALRPSRGDVSGLIHSLRWPTSTLSRIGSGETTILDVETCRNCERSATAVCPACP